MHKKEVILILNTKILIRNGNSNRQQTDLDPNINEV